MLLAVYAFSYYDFFCRAIDWYELITLAKGPEMLAIGYNLLLMFE